MVLVTDGDVVYGDRERVAHGEKPKKVDVRNCFRAIDVDVDFFFFFFFFMGRSHTETRCMEGRERHIEKEINTMCDIVLE
jgi:hypothetical protein